MPRRMGILHTREPVAAGFAAGWSRTRAGGRSRPHVDERMARLGGGAHGWDSANSHLHSVAGLCGVNGVGGGGGWRRPG
jgi:hypothetical protein